MDFLDFLETPQKQKSLKTSATQSFVSLRLRYLSNVFPSLKERTKRIFTLRKLKIGRGGEGKRQTPQKQS